LVAAHQPDGTRYFPGGEAIAPGTVVTLPGLGRVLTAWAADGGAVLAGDVGRAIVERVQQAGGVLTTADLACTGESAAIERLPRELAATLASFA
ncbi:MAG TPA: gamma-glutamyltransferase, partial [Roseiflexaceae bacterium]|nr:gamma-glutamyltransferase [Roseiflexaceae bacterium]